MSISVFHTDKPLAYPPRITAFTRHFWDGLRNGLFQTTQCQSCDHLTFPPKPICPKCWHEDIKWVECAVSGTLYSWTRIHAGPAVFSEELPYVVGVVDLDCGVRLACRLQSADLAQNWACGMAVKLSAGLADNGVLLVAQPA